VALIFSISIAQSRNLANNYATLHATEQSRNLCNATITQPCNATITQLCNATITQPNNNATFSTQQSRNLAMKQSRNLAKIRIVMVDLLDLE
jgi:hypothetical protein